MLYCAALYLQPAKVACIEYAREAGKDEQYPWVCLWKAVWVADSVLGPRAQVNSVGGLRAPCPCVRAGSMHVACSGTTTCVQCVA